MTIVCGLSVLAMRHVSIGETARLVVRLGLQEVTSLLSSHQVHVAPCMTENELTPFLLIVSLAQRHLYPFY